MRASGISGRKSIHTNKSIHTFSSDSESENSNSEKDGTLLDSINYSDNDQSLESNRARDKPELNDEGRKNICKESTGLRAVCLSDIIIYAVVLLAFAVAVVNLGASFFGVTSTSSVTKNCSFDQLRQLHPLQNNYVWRSLSVGIENIINGRSHTPGVYLLVHEGGEVIETLIKDIADHSSQCFSSKTVPVEIKSEDFTSEEAIHDYGYAIEKYKQKIKEGHVILIANLNEIPAEAARALHTICDTHSPIVRDVIIFLTLTIPTTNDSPIKNAEETLNSLWSSKLDRNELDPLITRVTDQVIALKS